MMRKLLFLAIVGCAAVAAADVDKVEGRIPAPNPTTAPPSNSTTASPTTPAPPTNKTTTAPTTTTTKPTTSTTSSPTTTTATTRKSTTTGKPTTTSPTSPTTVKPTPEPVPPKPREPIPGTWSLNYTGTNRTCIVLTLAAQIEIPYVLNATNKKNFTGYVNIPSNNATAIGTCGQQIQSITLQWNNTFNATNNVTFSFVKRNANATKFDLAKIEIAVVADNTTLPGYNGTIKLVEKSPLFNTSLTHSYKCFKKQTFNLTESNSNVTAGYIHLQHVQLQAFRNATGTVFAEAEDCAPYETPDVVPIAVGCALVALIVIVLVAYLIGRRRNQARGYLSMFSAEKNETDYIPMKNLNCFK